MALFNKNIERGHVRKHDIIQGIISSRLDVVVAALSEDPNCVNQVHLSSQMNAAMLCALGEMHEFLEEVLKYSSYQDFTHRDADGRDLLEVALASNDRKIVEIVLEAYQLSAPHIINNWPEP